MVLVDLELGMVESDLPRRILGGYVLATKYLSYTPHILTTCRGSRSMIVAYYFTKGFIYLRKTT